jgi:hypothetical protein
MVTSPNGTRFDVEVKGVGFLRGDWFGTPKPTREHLYYVLAVVARGAPNRFFVMTQQEVNDAIGALRAEAAAGQWKVIDGIVRSAAAPHEEKWEKLPQ